MKRRRKGLNYSLVESMAVARVLYSFLAFLWWSSSRWFHICTSGSRWAINIEVSRDFSKCFIWFLATILLISAMMLLYSRALNNCCAAIGWLIWNLVDSSDFCDMVISERFWTIQIQTPISWVYTPDRPLINNSADNRVASLCLATRSWKNYSKHDTTLWNVDT